MPPRLQNSVLNCADRSKAGVSKLSLRILKQLLFLILPTELEKKIIIIVSNKSIFHLSVVLFILNPNECTIFYTSHGKRFPLLLPTVAHQVYLVLVRCGSEAPYLVSFPFVFREVNDGVRQCGGARLHLLHHHLPGAVDGQDVAGEVLAGSPHCPAGRAGNWTRRRRK